MNKTLSKMLMALPLMVAATSCSEGDVTMIGTGDAIADGPRYIDVDVQTQRNTRCEEASLPMLQGTNGFFRISSFFTGDKNWATYVADKDFDMSHIENPFEVERTLKWTGKKWQYTPLAEWPEVGKTTFVSYFYQAVYAGGVYGTEYVKGKYPKIRLSQGMMGARCPDILFALNPNCTPDQNGGKVKINFKHILTRLNFQISMEKPIDESWGDADVTVYTMRILKTSKKLRDYVYFVIGQTDEIGEPPADGNPPTKCYFEEFSNPIRPTATYLDCSDIVKLDRLFPKTADGLPTKGPTPLFKDKEYLFLIPPSANGVETKDDIIIELAYYFNTYSENGALDKRVLKNCTFSMPIGSLKPGYAYLFNLILNPTENLIKPIAGVEEWKDVETYVAQAEASNTESPEIIKAWTELVEQNKTHDVKFSYYVLKVNGNLGENNIDISAAPAFKKPGAIVKMVFNDNPTPAKAADKLTLPAGYSVDTTVDRDIIIRYNKP